MKPYREFSPFQIRWKETLGEKDCPYMTRWVFVFFGFAIRLHHWIRSDDRRHFHDHPMHFISIILKGSYTNVTPEGSEVMKAGRVWFSEASKKHYIEVPEGGAWTLLLCGRRFRSWGFWVNNHLWRPLRYFHKFGHPPCDLQ